MSYTTREIQLYGSWLGLLKTRYTGSGRMELFGTRKNTVSFNSDKTTAVLPLELRDDGNGTFMISSNALYFIKTSNCSSGKVELHCVGRANNWSNFTIHTATVYSKTANRTFDIDGENLWCVNCDGDLNGNVELQVASRSSNYQMLRTFTTAYKNWMKDYGQFFVRNGSLYWVRTSLCQNGMVQVSRTYREWYCESNGSGGANRYFQHDYGGYNTWEYFVTCDDAKNGYFSMTVDGSVHFIKTQNCRSGNIEVHTGVGWEDYKKHHGAATDWSMVEATCATVMTATNHEVAG